MIDRLAAMRAMVEKQPNNPLARFGLANELLKSGANEEAADALATYLASYDDEGNGWLRYADVLFKLGRVEDARDAAKKGREASGRYGHGGMVEEFEGRLDEWGE